VNGFCIFPFWLSRQDEISIMDIPLIVNAAVPLLESGVPRDRTLGGHKRQIYPPEGFQNVPAKDERRRPIPQASYAFPGNSFEILNFMKRQNKLTYSAVIAIARLDFPHAA
jgi:hypothetical protein